MLRIGKHGDTPDEQRNTSKKRKKDGCFDGSPILQ